MDMDKDVFSFKDFIDEYLGTNKKSELAKDNSNESLIDINIVDDINESEPINIIEEVIHRNEVSEVIEIVKEEVDNDNYYKLYKDKNEEFSCDISIEGSSIEDTQVRIIIESEDWNLVFNGEIKNGKCVVPIKKLGILEIIVCSDIILLMV